MWWGNWESKIPKLWIADSFWLGKYGGFLGGRGGFLLDWKAASYYLCIWLKPLVQVWNLNTLQYLGVLGYHLIFQLQVLMWNLFEHMEFSRLLVQRSRRNSSCNWSPSIIRYPPRENEGRKIVNMQLCLQTQCSLNEYPLRALSDATKSNLFKLTI